MSPRQASIANLLLRALDQSDFALLEPYLERVQLKHKDPLFDPNEPIGSVYFLEEGVASIVAEQEGGDQVEVGLYGREGMSGAAVIMGAEQSPHAIRRPMSYRPRDSWKPSRRAGACACCCYATLSL